MLNKLKGRASSAFNRRGVTMTEVIVAFTVLLFLMASFSETLLLCIKIINRSEERRADVAALYSEYYTDDDKSDDRLISECNGVTLTDKTGNTIKISFNVKLSSYPDGTIYYVDD